jgi:hypothetical protein
MTNTKINNWDQIFPLSKKISISASKQYGVLVRIYIQEEARKLTNYNTPIDSSLKGQSVEGAMIEVNTLGRWLFGVPGYEGRVRVVSVNDEIDIFYPSKSSDIVENFLQEIKSNIEKI